MFYAGATNKKALGCIYRSPDGVVWELVHQETIKDNKERGAYGFFGFARNQTTLVAVGGGDNISKGGNVRMLSSKDGTTWDGPIWRFENGGALTCVAFGKDRFVTHGGEGPWAYFSTSTDGKEWDDPDKHRIQKWQGWEKMVRKVAFGNDLFLGIGATRRVVTSPDGRTWKDYPDPERKRPAFISLAFGNGVFVAGGMHGLRATSKDGARWENEVTGEIGEHLNEIVWTGKEFVALGIEATYKSPDGVTWTKAASNVRPARACYGAGVYLCTNLRGTECYRSEDAIHWKALPRLADGFFSGAFTYFLPTP
ncbi:MAG: hypothetical protein JNM56_24295 [Planctomycetia bacterium]|nr:hypothetical protein [Planctomycetia bacterium]